MDQKDEVKKLPFKQVQIVFENDDIVAVNKPSGILTIPDRAQSERSLKEYLNDKYGEIFTVHRIDRDTSGIVLFAKNEAMHRYLSQLFEQRKVKKFYMGIVLGMPANTTGLINAPIAEHPFKKGQMHINRSGKASSTGYEVLRAFPAFSLVKFALHTGRTHQIRVHSKEIGHPLAVDEMYGDGRPVFLSSIKKKYKAPKYEEEKPIISRLALHAYQLIFSLPDGTEINLTAEMPKEFKALFQQLEKL